MIKHLVLTGALLALNPAIGAAQDRSAFEVASVKRSPTAAQGSSVRLTPGGRLVARNATLELLITTAYKVRDAQLIGGPSWIKAEHFDIEAKALDRPGADQVPRC